MDFNSSDILAKARARQEEKAAEQERLAQEAKEREERERQEREREEQERLERERREQEEAERRQAEEERKQAEERRRQEEEAAREEEKERQWRAERQAIYLRRQRRNNFFSVLGVLLVLGGIVFGIRGIAKKIASRPKPEFVIGGKGQGGVVFYDKGEYTDGWRYLECSLTYLEKTYYCKDKEMLVGLKPEIGTGDFNTVALITYKGADTAAAKACVYAGGGYDEWYLPNRAEAREIYKNLVKNKKGKRRAKKIAGYEKICQGIFDSPSMWTSEMVDEEYAYSLDTSLLNGGRTYNSHVYRYTIIGMTGASSINIRPIRKF